MSHLWRRVCLLLLVGVLPACSGLVEIEANGVDVVLDPPMLTSSLLAADGSVLADLHAEQDRELVALDEIPQVVRDAVVAVEDARFYSHDGLDGRAIARALLVNVIERDVVQGGSTITQQLAKNAVVGSDRTLQRKLAEASIALQLEAQMSKDEILEHYLNVVYFGSGAYGVGAAARTYFGVDVDRLGVAEAALLAGLLRAPSVYDPFDNPEGALQRRDVALRLMLDQGYVDRATYHEAAASDLGLTARRVRRDWRHPYAVDHALHVLQHDPAFHVLGDTPGERASRLYGGGLTIETSIDVAWQDAATAAISDTLIAPDEDPAAALVAIDPASGEIRALVGGADYDDTLVSYARFNLATDGRRQPGSAFKPLVLAAALEQGWQLDDILPAPAAVTLPLGDGRVWDVANASGAAFGELSLRGATALSVNVVFAQLIAEIGVDAVIDAAQRAGVTSDLQPLLSLALGAQEVSPLEMASVAATFAAGGVHRPPGIITRIVDPDGVAIWERPGAIGVRTFAAQTASDVTLALRDVISAGTGTGATLPRPVAGKTGTSQDNADAWFMGYTPDMAVAVWVGYPEARVPMVPPRTRVTVQGGGWPAEIFARFGVAALADAVATPFQATGDVLLVDVDVSRGCLPNPYTPRHLVAEQAFTVGTEPSTVCTEPAGPPTVDVPTVDGLPEAAARAALEDAGFAVVSEPEFSQQLPPGVVLRQHPAAGPAQLLTGTGYAATIWVSTAQPPGSRVPDVLSRSIDAARSTLEEEGFSVVVRLTCPDGTAECTGASQRPGQVWEQVPDVDAAVQPGSTVVLSAYPG